MFYTGCSLFLIGISIVTFEVYRYQKNLNYRLDFLFFFHLAFIPAYSIAPFLMGLGGSEFALAPFPVKYSITESAQSVVVILCGYLAVLMGYYSKILKLKSKKFRFKGKFKRKTARLFWLLGIAFGIFSCIVFVSRYGGFSFFVQNISGIRSGNFDRDNIGAVLSTFIDLVRFCTVMLFAIIYQKKCQGKDVPAKSYIWLAGSLVLTVFVTVLRGSRSLLGAIFFSCYYTACLIRRKLIINRYIIVAVGLLLIIGIYGKSIIFQVLFAEEGNLIQSLSQAFNQQETIDKIAALNRDFSHPYLSLRVAFDAAGNTIPLRWFSDFPLGIYFYAQLLGIKTPYTIGYYHNQVIMGEFDSNIPPSLFGVFWYSAQFPGILLGCFIYGLIGRILNNFFRPMLDNSFAIPVYVELLISYIGFVSVGELRTIFQNSISLITVILFVVFVFFRIYYKKPTF